MAINTSKTKFILFRTQGKKVNDDICKIVFNNNEEEDAEAEEEGQTMDTDGNNDEEEDVEGERVHRCNTRSCTNFTDPIDFDQMASLSYARFNNNRDISDESDT